MEVEKISPVANSPLDSCRGRGKHPILPRIRSTRPRPAAASTCDDASPSIILLVVQEPRPKVGTPKDGSNSSKTN